MPGKLIGIIPLIIFLFYRIHKEASDNIEFHLEIEKEDAPKRFATEMFDYLENKGIVIVLKSISLVVWLTILKNIISK